MKNEKGSKIKNYKSLTTMQAIFMNNEVKLAFI